MNTELKISPDFLPTTARAGLRYGDPLDTLFTEFLNKLLRISCRYLQNTIRQLAIGQRTTLARLLHLIQVERCAINVWPACGAPVGMWSNGIGHTEGHICHRVHCFQSFFWEQEGGKEQRRYLYHGSVYVILGRSNLTCRWNEGKFSYLESD